MREKRSPAGVYRVTAPERVDVDSSATEIEREDFKALKGTSRAHLVEDPLDTLLMEALVVPKAEQIAQERAWGDLFSFVGDEDTPPVGLRCHRAEGAEEVTVDLIVAMGSPGERAQIFCLGPPLQGELREKRRLIEGAPSEGRARAPQTL